MVGLQCLDCGGGWRAVKQSTVPDVDSLPWYDAELSDRLWRELADQRHDQADFDRRLKRQQWWDDYAQYLSSAQWRARADERLRMDNRVCQARVRCRGDYATEVHHLTYAHLGDEPMFDLVSVCHQCHEVITDMDRKNRGEEDA